MHQQASQVCYPSAGSGLSDVAVIFPSGSAVNSHFMYSFDGRSWSQASMPAMASGVYVIDAAFDNFTNTLYVLVGDGSTTWHIWSSSTTALGTWTLVQGFAANSYSREILAMAACGRELVLWIGWKVYQPSLTYLYSSVTSVDGGATWRGPNGIRTSTAPSSIFFELASSNSSTWAQFIYANQTEYAASIAVGGLTPCGVL